MPNYLHPKSPPLLLSTLDLDLEAPLAGNTYLRRSFIACSKQLHWHK